MNTENENQKEIIIQQLLQRAREFGINENEQPIPHLINTDEPDGRIQMVPVEDNMVLSEEENILIYRITHFFTKNMIKYRVMPIVNRETNFSLRDLFWTMTNYFREKQVRYMVLDEEYPVNLNENYVAWMNHFGKGNCDTYQRGNRHFRVICAQDPSFEFVTTISQLILFEWAIRRLVCEYTSDHVQEIKQHQRDATERSKLLKEEKGSEFKRQPLTKAPPKDVFLYPGQVRLNVHY